MPPVIAGKHPTKPVSLVMGIVEFIFSGYLRVTEAYTDAIFDIEVPAGMQLPPFLPGDLVLADVVNMDDSLAYLHSGTLLQMEILDEVGQFTLSPLPELELCDIPF